MLKKIMLPLVCFSLVFANIPDHGNCSVVNQCHCKKDSKGCYTNTAVNRDEFFPRCYNDMANHCESDCKTFCENLPGCSYDNVKLDKACKAW